MVMDTFFKPSIKKILERPIGEGWPTRAELRAGAPSIFADHSADGGYEAVYAGWEGYRESLAEQVAHARRISRWKGGIP